MTPLDFLMPTELALILQDAAGITSDPQIAQPITYKSFQGRTFVPSTGLWTSTFTDYSIRAIRNTLSAAELAVAGGQYQGDDIRYLIAQVDIPEPQDDDLLVSADGSRYRMVGWDTDPINAFWAIVVRLVKSA